MKTCDDNLLRFEAGGGAPLPTADESGYVDHDGARIWYASFGAGAPVILLHGGLGHAGNWGYQVPALVAADRRVVVIDSRGHGRSTRDARPYTYERMAGDISAVMTAIGIDRCPFIGWSDGACIALVLARHQPARVSGVYFFGCNMDPSGAKDVDAHNPLLGRCFRRHARDYAALSATPDQFDAFAAAVGDMQRTQPNYSADELASIRIPVTVAHAEHDEFIHREHAEYLARTLPGARFESLPGVSHFAPLQRPEQFDASVLRFLAALR